MLTCCPDYGCMLCRIYSLVPCTYHHSAGTYGILLLLPRAYTYHMSIPGIQEYMKFLPPSKAATHFTASVCRLRFECALFQPIIELGGIGVTYSVRADALKDTPVTTVMEPPHAHVVISRVVDNTRTASTFSRIMYIAHAEVLYLVRVLPFIVRH